MAWTREEYLVFHKECLEKMTDITTRKNHDYTGGSEDPFFNFTGVERDQIALTETGFLVRMKDKFSRITTFVNKGVLKVADESVIDTLLDLANYCILMAGYIKSKREDAAKAINLEHLSTKSEPSYSHNVTVPVARGTGGRYA